MIIHMDSYPHMIYHMDHMIYHIVTTAVGAVRETIALTSSTTISQ